MTVPVYSDGREDRDRQHGLVDVVDLGASGSSVGLSMIRSRAVGEEGPVDHGGGGGDEREVELALEALPDDLHVQQAEEAAAEPEAQRVGGLGLEGEGGVVELELLERVAQVRQVVAVDRVEAAEDHRLGVAVALERLGRPAAGSR